MKKLSTLICMLTINMAAYSQSLDDHIKTGVQLHDAGRYSEAIASYRQALLLDNNSSLVQYEMSNTYCEMKQYDSAVLYANKVIATNGNELEHAYIIKGTALDMQNKMDDALQAYKEGLKRNPTSYLLNYNTALTYLKQKQYSDAEGYAIDALKANIHHSSSHMILGYCKYAGDRRSECLLAWYYFLMLEPGSKRAANVFELAKKQMGAGVTKKSDNSINVNITRTDEKDEFSALELMVSMLAAARYTEENTKKTEDELFISATESFFKMAGELNDKGKNSKNIWWNSYVPFFYELAKAGHTPTLCYYISAPHSQAASTWLNNHDAEVKKFSQWYEAYNSK